ncbi:MAG: hypothetical protein ABI647_23390 [Gemmatimonadota bacterium]
MRPRTEVLLGLGVLALLTVLATALGARRNRSPSFDLRASTYLAGPMGSRGLAEGLERLGITVRRYRQRPRQLAEALGESERRRAFVLLDPPGSLSAVETSQLLLFHSGESAPDLILAGPGAAAPMRCLGYKIGPVGGDSAAVGGPELSRSRPAPEVTVALKPVRDTAVTDSTRIGDFGVVRCVAPRFAKVDTLLRARGRPVAVRLTRADVGPDIVLIADGSLVRNRALRRTAAGAFMLGLFAGRYDQVVFDEYQQGYGGSGSLAGATLEWSRRSPLGWAAWQLAAVGLLALGFGAVRFGAARSFETRRRRSPLEHVRALATVLDAANGHDVAIGLLIKGLRRRLRQAGAVDPAGQAGWLDQLARNVSGERGTRAVATLEQVTRPGQSRDGVLRAANAVEDLWEELRP